MKQFSIIGTLVPMLDAKNKVTGKAIYGADITLPNILYGKVLRSPYPHARILNIDTSRAEQLLGVKAVVTGADTPRIRWGAKGIDDEPILCFDGKVRYAGEEVAAVAAIDEDLAEEALDLIKVDYEELTAVFDPEEAMQPGAPQIHEEMPEVKNNVGFEVSFERGNVEEGFREADVIVKDKFMNTWVNQAYMEPSPCIASFDTSGKLTLYASTMWNSQVREAVSSALQIPLGKVRVIQPVIGGAFGGKMGGLPIHFITTLLARKAGRPVKVIQTREEDFITARHRCCVSLEVRMGAKKDGTITAEYRKAIGDQGAYMYLGPDFIITVGLRGDLLYRFKNTRYEGKLVYTNKCPPGAFRGFGNTQACFPRESLLDMLAEKLGMDTTELKLRNCARPGDVSPHGWPLNSCGLAECIEKTVESSGWKEKKAKKQPKRGIGIASTGHETDMRVLAFGGSVSILKLLEDGKVQLLSGEAEYGQGGQTSSAMAIAEELEIPMEDIEVVYPDTDITPYALGPLGSRVLSSQVTASRLAALEVKKQALGVASEMLKAKVEDLEMRRGKIYIRGTPERVVTLSDVGYYAIQRPGGSIIIGKGVDERNTERTLAIDHPTHYGPNVSASYFDTVVAEVEVDTETGEIRVLKLTVADDCGKVINLMGIEGQLQGATTQGLGATFTEQTILEEGRVLNPNFRNYLVPTSINVPPIDIIWVESNELGFAYGCKGGGESPGINSVIPAIANAIYDAVGVRIKTLPITPDKILKALAEREGK